MNNATYSFPEIAGVIKRKYMILQHCIKLYIIQFISFFFRFSTEYTPI